MAKQGIRTVAYHDNPWAAVIARARASLAILTCVTELVDNAADASATSVHIEVRPGKHLLIRDNGVGIPRLDALVGMGEHVAHAKSGSGVYGVGFKDAALRMGGEFSKVKVETTVRDVTYDASIDWASLRTSRKCMTIASCAARGPTGTTLIVSPLKMRWPTGQDRERFIEDLRYTYFPALAKRTLTITLDDGREPITLRDEPVLPSLKRETEVGLELSFKRRPLYVYAGIITDGESTPYQGLTYLHGYRVVKRASRAGCGRKSIDRFCGVVELRGDGWPRATNKNDIIDCDDLYPVIEKALADLLAKADQESRTLLLDQGLIQLASELSAIVPAVIGEGEGMAGRQRGEKTGDGVPGAGPHASPQPASDQRDGHNRHEFGDGKGVRAGLRINPMSNWRKGEPIGRFDGASVIDLYKDHPFLTGPYSREKWFAAAIVTMATTRQQSATEAALDIAELLGRVARGATMDGQPLRAAE